MAGTNVNQVGGKQGGLDPQQFAIGARREVFQAAGLSPDVDLKTLGPKARAAAKEILSDLTAKGRGVNDADLAAAEAKLREAIRLDGAVAYKPPAVPSGDVSAIPQKVPLIVTAKDGKLMLSPSLQKTPEGKEHALAGALKKLGITDLSNLPPNVADVVNEMLGKPGFSLSNKQNWRDLNVELAKVAPRGAVDATAPVAKTEKTAGDTVTPEPQAQVDHKKVGTSSGKGVRGNWLNALAANMSAKPSGKAQTDAVSTAARDVLAEMGIEKPTPQQQKAAEEVLNGVMKGAVADGEVKPGKVVANAWMQLADATGVAGYKQAAAFATKLQSELDKLPKDEQAAHGASAAMTSMVPGIVATAIGEKAGVDVKNPSQEMFDAIGQLLAAMGVDPTKISADAAAPAAKASEVSAVRTETDKIRSKADRLFQLIDRAVASNSPELAPQAQAAKQAYEAGDYGAAQSAINQMGRALLDPNNPVPYEVKDVNLERNRMTVALKHTADCLHQLAATPAPRSMKAAADLPVTAEAKAAARKAFDEIMAGSPGLKASSPEGKKIIAALEQVYARGGKSDLEIIQNSFSYLSEKTGQDLGARAAFFAGSAAQNAQIPGAAAQLRQMALKEVANHAIDPNAYLQGLAAMSGVTQGLPAGAGSPIAGPGGWDASLKGNQRSAVGFAILNDPSLSFEDKLFLFMMYMAQFAEEDELKKMEEIAELDRKEEMKQARLTKINADLPTKQAQRKSTDADAARAAADLQRLKEKDGVEPKVMQEATQKADATRAAAQRARGEEDALRQEQVQIKQESPPKSRDMLNMELRRLEQWRGMLMDMVKQIIEERNRRIRQIWQG